ncbi:MAG: thiaminase II [Actinomycetota bacterium]
MNIMSRLRKDSKQIWDSIEEHPFIVELCNGSLPLEKFKHYVLQEYHFLVAGIRNFSIIASRAEPVEDIIELVEISPGIAVSEYKNYLKLLESLGLGLEDAKATQPIPIVCAYSDFLISVSYLGSYPEALIAILPCFWSYCEIIKPHKEKLDSNRCQLYQNWAKAYCSSSYYEVMDRIKEVAERASANTPYQKLKYLFLKASRYEYMYWDNMYNLKGWDI